MAQAMMESKLGYFSATPFLRFFFSATSAVFMRRIGSRERIHIVDFSVMLGAQWITLLLDLGKRECGPPKSVRITSVMCTCSGGLYRPMARNSSRDILDQLKKDLQRAAKAAGISHFEHATTSMVPTDICNLYKVEGRRSGEGQGSWEAGREGRGNGRRGEEEEWEAEEELLAVRGCFDLECLPDSGVIRTNPRDAVLEVSPLPSAVQVQSLAQLSSPPNSPSGEESAAEPALLLTPE